jgi:hypothetical protein
MHLALTLDSLSGWRERRCRRRWCPRGTAADKGSYYHHYLIVDMVLTPQSFFYSSRDEHGVEMGLGAVGPAALGKTTDEPNLGQTVQEKNPNRYRLERFGKAMSGSVSWEVPAAVLNGKYRLLTDFYDLLSDARAYIDCMRCSFAPFLTSPHSIRITFD